MNYLSLFTGVGGGDLAFQHLLEGFRCVGYVEYEKYCQDVIRQRIEDGLLDCAPIFGDIREFNREYAEGYKGMVDLITAGFPCQPFSVAGKQKGKDDSRNMWPEAIRSVRLVRPQYCFFENVPGLLASGYMPRIFADVAETGYNAKWTVLGANDVGANHKRKRLWVLANAQKWQNNKRKRRDLEKKTKSREGINPTISISDNNVSNSSKQNDRPNSSESIDRQIQQPRKCDFKRDVANAGESGLSEPRCKSCGRMSTKGENWATEPALGRVAHGVANRMDRLKAIGNGQVPQCAATAWRVLSGMD